MLKIIRKIFLVHSFESGNKIKSAPILRYLFYAIGEIVLVVAGILIASIISCEKNKH